MSQLETPYGLSQVSYKGGKYRGSLNTYYISSGYGQSFGQGDPVQMGSGGYVGAYTVQPTNVTGATMTLGTFVSVTYVNTQGQTVIAPYWPASTLTYNNQPAIVTVNDLPYVVYQVQCSGSIPNITAPTSASGSIGQTGVGKTFNLIATAGTDNAPNPATGQSQAALLVTTTTINAAYNTVQIVGLADPKIGGTNSWYDPFPDVLVIINNHAFNAGRPGA